MVKSDLNYVDTFGIFNVKNLVIYSTWQEWNNKTWLTEFLTAYQVVWKGLRGYQRKTLRKWLHGACKHGIKGKRLNVCFYWYLIEKTWIILTKKMICAKFEWNCSSGSRDDDEQCVILMTTPTKIKTNNRQMLIGNAHEYKPLTKYLSLWLRWTKMFVIWQLKYL